MSYPRTGATTTSAATTTPIAIPNRRYDASPATPTVAVTPSASTPSNRVAHRTSLHSPLFSTQASACPHRPTPWEMKTVRIQARYFGRS